MPGHINFQGNKNADEASKEAAKKAGTWRFHERFASLAYVECTV